MPDFPAAEIAFTKFKVKAVITCQYELGDMEDYAQVKEDVEQALSTLRQYGSAEVTFHTERSEVSPAPRRRP